MRAEDMRCDQCREQVSGADTCSRGERLRCAWPAVLNDRFFRSANGCLSLWQTARDMYAGPLRFLRALIVSATCVALSLATHLIGAGAGAQRVSLVEVLGLLTTTVLLTLVLGALSGRRWTLGRSLVALGSGQVVLHVVFTVLLTSPHHHSHGAPTAGWLSMTLAHTVAALLVGVGIAVNDSALDTHLSLACSRVASGLGVCSPWRLAGLTPGAETAGAVSGAGRGEQLARWQRPRILTSLVVLQCRSSRGPPEPALVSSPSFIFS